MTESRPPLAAFADETFEHVAANTGFTVAQLEELVGTHQEGVRDLPGVDDIVYEWRNHFHLDPLVHRTESVYVLAVPSHVWEEFADRQELTPDQLDALKVVHDHQARHLLAATDRFDGDDAMVLTRP